MTESIYLEAFRKLVATACPMSVVRKIEAGDAGESVWTQFEGSGFVDALVGENAGGSGLRLEDLFPLLLVCGTSAMPLPLAYTMYARAALVDDGESVPRGPITLASGRRDDGVLRCRNVPWGMVSNWVLAEVDGDRLLLPRASAALERAGPPGSLLADLHWTSLSDARPLGAKQDVRSVAAALLAAHMAGAMLELLDRSIAHAGERKQFGRSIGGFQAIQQQLSSAAEHVFAAHMAAEIGCRGGWQSRSYLPAPLGAALAKARCSDAVARVAATAHAVHGAIGITREFDLQLLTRRLHEWRLAHGGEAYWQRLIGAALLTTPVTMLDFVRERLVATATE